jgi:hypothetical protein
MDIFSAYLFSFLPPKMVNTHIVVLYHALPHSRPWSCHKALIDKFCVLASYSTRSLKATSFNQIEWMSITICVKPKEFDFSPSCSKIETNNNGMQIANYNVPYQILDL